jgi:hypothetical protein
MLIDLFEQIKAIDWNILVCATKSRGATVDYIEAQAGTYAVEWIEHKWVPVNHDAANEITAREILRKLASQKRTLWTSRA